MAHMTQFDRMQTLFKDLDVPYLIEDRVEGELIHHIIRVGKNYETCFVFSATGYYIND